MNLLEAQSKGFGPSELNAAIRHKKRLEYGDGLLKLAQSPSEFDTYARYLGWPDLIGKYYSRDRVFFNPAGRRIAALDIAISRTEPRRWAIPLESTVHARPTVLSGKILQLLSVGYPNLRPRLPVHYQYGWYWHPTTEISDTIEALQRIGFEGTIWETPQFRAIERLIGTEILSFPNEFDWALEGVFMRIGLLEVLCGKPQLKSDIVSALEKLESASEHLKAAMDELGSIHPGVWSIFDRGPPAIKPFLEEINLCSAGWSLALGGAKGGLYATLQWRERIHEVLTGKSGGKGRPSNWVAELVTQVTADIYRTCYPGKIKQEPRGSKRPPFSSFLRDFAQGYPDAERADYRALARRVWKGEFEGRPFAPI